MVLWPVRILTDFGQDEYVLALLALGVVVTILIAPLWPEATRSRLLNFATHVQYLFFAVLSSVLAAQVLKYVIGRGRPFVGGKANAFNFEPFNGTPAYFSMPSAHAVTAFALAFAVAAVWPRLRVPMYIYAVAIAASRLVHESMDDMDLGTVRALQGFIGQGIAPVAASIPSVPDSNKARDSCGNHEMTASAKSMRNRNGSRDFMT